MSEKKHVDFFIERTQDPSSNDLTFHCTFRFPSDASFADQMKVINSFLRMVEESNLPAEKIVVHPSEKNCAWAESGSFHSEE